MASLKWNDIFCKTLRTLEDNKVLKVSVSACKDKDGKITGVISQLRWFYNDKPTKEGMSLNSAQLASLWRENEDHHRADGWSEDTPNHKIGVAFNRDLSVTIAASRNDKSSILTLDYDTFRDFIEMIPCLKYIVGAICAQKKEYIAKQILCTFLTLKLDTVTDDILKAQYEKYKPRILIVASTLEVPKLFLVAALWHCAFVDECREHVRDKEERVKWHEMICPITDNELFK